MTFEQIGQQLRTARDTLGLSLAQIQERTKIPFNHLQSLDNGRVEDLPEPVYVSGFIKRYAECVGLDGQRLSDEYKQVVEASNNPNGRFTFFPKAQKDTHIATAPAPAYYKSTKLAQPAPNVLKSLPFYLFWVVVVLTLVTYLVTRQQSNEAGQQDPSVLGLRQTTDKLANLPPPTVTTGTGVVNDTPPTPAPPTDARIALTASQHVWVEVKAVSSGDTVFTGFLERGDRKDFQDTQGLRVRAGNGGSLTVEKDGKSQTLGEPGKKIEKAFLAKDANPATATADVATDAKTAGAKPAAGTTATKKPVVAKKPGTATVKPYRKLDGMGTHRDLPGGSLGGSAIDVPYRY